MSFKVFIIHHSPQNHIQILIDSESAEQQYLSFIVTPAGGQADYLDHYHEFSGHFRRKPDWNGDWNAKTSWLEDGYTVEIAIPISTFLEKGQTAIKPGQSWRFNVVVQTKPEDEDKSLIASWSSPQQPFYLPRHFGTLHGKLIFED